MLQTLRASSCFASVKFAGAMYLQVDETTRVSIDSGSDERCALHSMLVVGRRCRERVPQLTAVEGTEMKTAGLVQVSFDFLGREGARMGSEHGVHHVRLDEVGSQRRQMGPVGAWDASRSTPRSPRQEAQRRG